MYQYNDYNSYSYHAHSYFDLFYFGLKQLFGFDHEHFSNFVKHINV